MQNNNAKFFQQSSYKLKFWEVFDEKKMADVRLACSLPMGWRVQDGKVLSPWADLKVEWPEAPWMEWPGILRPAAIFARLC